MSSSQEPNSGKAAKVAVALLIAIAGGAGLYFLPQWQASDEAQSEQVAQDQVSQPVFMPQTAAAGAPAAGAATAVAVEPVAENTVTTVIEPLTAALTAVAPAVSADAAVVAAPAIADAAAANTNVPSAEAQPNAASANASSTSAAAVAEGSSAQAAPADSAMLKFAATGESWVQVRDAQGRVVMEKILKAGDVYEEAAAGRPLQVVVGNAGVTKLEIDGATFDLAAAAKNNVARFEVK